MLTKSNKNWQLPSSKATDEKYYYNRRQFINKSFKILSSASISSSLLLSACDDEGAATELNKNIIDKKFTDPSLKYYPLNTSSKYSDAGRPILNEMTSSRFNNFFEFGTSKYIDKKAANLALRPWEIIIDGEVEKVIHTDIDKILAKMPLEERIYRHRCVETWAMVIPWSGFALKELVALAKPTSKAKHIKFETFFDPKVASNQNVDLYPWPYIEYLTIEEATNDLAFMATGVYGHPAQPQFGAPLRLVVPWKYGFKSIKSITKISFVVNKGKSFWEEIASDEYGFWANVNPDVPHKRWSQKKEYQIGSNEYYDTQLFNGYADEVAHLYKNIKSHRLYT